jgi:heterodisulfide reductase subunit A2
MKSEKHICIIGAGIAGLESAVCLARHGYKVTVLEKEAVNGGKLNQWGHLFPDFSEPAGILQNLRDEVKKYRINVIYQTEVTGILQSKGGYEGYEVYAGNFIRLKPDVIIVSSGFNLFDATRKEEYGYGLFDNVLTSADLEQVFKQKKQVVMRNGRIPRRIAIIHCVGSRDSKSGNTYCSKICCITGIKQAITLNKILPECEIFCFYMDLRLYGSNFDEIYLSAQKQHKIQFIRGRLSEAAEKNDKSLQIKAEDTLSGRPLRMDVDMMVLLAGMEPGNTNRNFISSNSLDGDENGFFKSLNPHNKRNFSNRQGVFLAGSCIGPMSVNDTLENARSAALEVMGYLDNTDYSPYLSNLAVRTVVKRSSTKSK